jgi:osmotically-inducible protein OsmY
MPLSRLVPIGLAALAAGAALVYFLDPSSGRRRRHVTRDRGVSLARRGGQRGRRFARHAASEATGAARRARNSLPRPREPLDDAELAHKVETILFRDPDVPKGQINVNAENGVVFLRGEVERPELLADLEGRVRKVQGVEGVENLLHLPGSPPPARR